MPAGWDGRAAEVGDAVTAPTTMTFTRDSLVRYAGASGDFNPIHYRDDIATAVGLPGVLAHGMLTMGAAIQPLVQALGDPARIVSYSTRFTRPVVVDADEGAEVTIDARVGQTAGDDGVGRIDLTVTCAGKTVLGKAQVRARFAPGTDGDDETDARAATR
ncbi:MaoC/PaaZ C-terminal domain-containing protein [Pseudoclavibacter endophyticus]|uniref:Acyl dehydratase n=1 Tax=Pseudoclavibacter endophyticus TaxID=1778590 RepID=A0A6H9WLN3_9MICO|nr:MaoC/PaaZ C-terminal domain-containing protein [Pseudoclavibacter endophyticus]KAB1648442.1 acyl dehydratase [Pseudoclavibacter endophyticus]